MSRRSRTGLAFALAALAAAAGAGWAKAPAASPAGTPRPEIVRPDPGEDLQWAASVVQVDDLRHQGDVGAKLFGTAGGDPAMNGLNTYLAFFESPADGWRVFRLGDFLEYRIRSETPGRIALEVRDNVMDERTGDIGTRARRLLVAWRPGPGGALPAAVSVTAAR
jgi:hypothetical protein